MSGKPACEMKDEWNPGWTPMIEPPITVRDNAGIKHDDGKPRMDLLYPYWLEQVASVLGDGAREYGEDNWTKGLAYRRLLGATLRHVFAILRGEDLDPKSGKPHWAHASCELMFLAGMTRMHPELDDRIKDPKGDALIGVKPGYVFRKKW